MSDESEADWTLRNFREFILGEAPNRYILRCHPQLLGAEALSLDLVDFVVDGAILTNTIARALGDSTNIASSSDFEKCTRCAGTKQC
jgi:tRNA threonylcarbamoyladenosine modification (KEOPS) complex Cgi121 subunit